jgi:hypothetical protein
MSNAITTQEYIVKSICAWKGWAAEPLRDYIRFTKQGWNKTYSGIAHAVADNGMIYIDSERLYRAKTDRVFFADIKRSKLFWCNRSDLQKFLAKGKSVIDTLGNLPKFMSKGDGWRQTVHNNDSKPAVVETIIVNDTNERDKEAVIAPKFKKVVNRIFVQFEKEGVHKYPAALTDPKLATGGWDDVSFLGYPHRHVFKFRVEIEVFHEDRDIEFIQFKRWLENLYNDGTLQLDYRSCEMISDELAEKINDRYPGRKIHIQVSEDGENGSVAVYIPA